MSSSAATSASLIAFLLCLAAAAGGAGTPPSIAVVANGCGAGLREVRELPERLAVELQPVRIDAGAADVVEVVTSCTAVEQITFWPAGNEGAPRTRPVSLEDVAPGLRAVALAVLTAEFLRTTWNGAPASVPAPVPSTEPAPVGTAAMPPVDVVPPAQPPTSPSASAAAPAPPELAPVPPTKGSPLADRPVSKRTAEKPGKSFGAAGTFRWFAPRSTTLWGGELSMNTAPWLFAASAAVGQTADVLGTLGFGLVALSAGGRISLVRWDDVQIGCSAVGEIGFTWAQADTHDPRVAAGATNALFLALLLGPDLDVSLSRAVGLTLGVRAGFARGLSITADRREVGGTQGFATTATMGLRYTP